MFIMIKHWVQAARPKTLTAAVVPVLATTALAYSVLESVPYWISVLALVASIFIQIGTNLVNDVVDFKKGTDSHDRLGPARVTHSKIFTEAQVWWGVAVAFILAILFGLPLVIYGGLPILFVGLVSLFFAYAYTGGPFPLSYWGLGDLFVVIFFGLVPCFGLWYLLGGTPWLSQEVFILGLQIGLHCAVLIAVNNLRDIESDRRAGRRTWPVLFGIAWAKGEIFFLIWFPFLLGLYWPYVLWQWPSLLPFLVIPLAIKLTRNIFATAPSSTYNKFLGQAALLHLVFGLLTSVGIILCQ